jgi:hypothetical protein
LELLFNVHKELKTVSEASKHTYSKEYIYLGVGMHVFKSPL